MATAAADTKPTTPSAAPEGVNPADVRAWAIENGFPGLAGRRGRMSGEVFAAFFTVHTPTGKPRKAKGDKPKATKADAATA